MSKKSCEAAGSIEDALFANGAVNCSQSCGTFEWRGELFAKLWNVRMAR